MYGSRNEDIQKNRDYATDSRHYYIQEAFDFFESPMTEMEFVELGFTPVPILPKFVRIVVTRSCLEIPYPNLEAVDPVFFRKEQEKEKIRTQGEL